MSLTVRFSLDLKTVIFVTRVHFVSHATIQCITNLNKSDIDSMPEVQKSYPGHAERSVKKEIRQAASKIASLVDLLSEQNGVLGRKNKF